MSPKGSWNELIQAVPIFPELIQRGRKSLPGSEPAVEVEKQTHPNRSIDRHQSQKHHQRIRRPEQDQKGRRARQHRDHPKPGDRQGQKKILDQSITPLLNLDREEFQAIFTQGEQSPRKPLQDRPPIGTRFVEWLHKWSPAIAVGLAGDQITQKRTDADAHHDGLIRMLVNGYIRDLGARDRSIPGSMIDFLPVFQGLREAFAGFAHTITGDVRGRCDERPSVLGQST